MVDESTLHTIDLLNSDLRPLPVFVLEAEDKLAQWESGKPEGVSTGFATLDKYFRLVNAEYITIAARPSQGKTALGVQLAQNIAEHLQRAGDGGVVAVFSAEMSGWALTVRMAGAMAGVNTHKLRMSGGAPAERKADADKVRAALAQLKALPIWIDDGNGPTTALMLDRLARLNDVLPVRFMLFDYMELGGDKAPGNSEELRISGIAKSLKGIAKALNIPVCGLCQLSREVENRANKMPVLSDLRYSGAIEAVSDVVLSIMRPEYYVERGMAINVPQEDRSGVAYISVLKNRNGPVGNVRMAFVKQQQRFADLARSEVQL